MRYTPIVTAGLALVLALVVPPSAHAIPAIQTPVDTTQPDGTELTVRLFGDEWYHFYEDLAGYTIVQDADGWWWYAELDADDRFQASPYRVGKDDPGVVDFLDRIGRQLREPREYWTENRERFFERTLPGILDRAAEMADEQGRVAMSVPVVLTQYPDFFASQTAASFENMMNQPGYNGTGSFQDYYTEVSYGNLTVTATVYGWYTAPSNRNHYRHGTGSLVELNRARELVRNAVDQAEATGGANWAPFDNDLDGNVDVVFIVHQGPGAECGNTNFIWSHHWYLNAAGTNYSVNYDAKLIDRYIIMPEMSCGGSHIEIGVFCHEYGHALGLPDLYDIDNSSEGIGNWGLMGGGGWGCDGGSPETPCHLSAWSKIEQGWITPTVVAANTSGVAFPAVETTASVHKVWTNGAPGTEYFLVEHRQRIGFGSNLLTGGLAIWHIDEAQRATNNTDNSDENHKLVDLEEADGLDDLDNHVNRGDDGDLFPGSTVNRFFNDGTYPDAHDYGGGNTQVCVDNISNPGATMTADICVLSSLPPNLLIRDCAADMGAEPNLPCAGNWVQSLDIWIDNNDDGIIDAPIQGVVNHLYVRAWNLGGPDVNANIKCWYVNQSLGLTFGAGGNPGQTPIMDAVTFQTQLPVPSIGNLPPSAGGQGHRAYFNWLIPNPPPSIDHYCIGCLIESPADPQTSPVPLDENNLGQINYWALALKSGTTPAKDMARDDVTVFRQEIQVHNPFDDTREFLVQVSGLEPPFFAEPGGAELVLQPQEMQVLTFDIIKENSEHGDAGRVQFELFAMPDFEKVGGLINDLMIDDYAPQVVPDWSVEYFQPQGDNFPRPMPTYELTWGRPDFDEAGLPEQVRYYDVHAALDPEQLLQPNEETLLARTGADADPQKPGYQFWYFAQGEEDHEVYFTVQPVDLADNPGAPAPPMTAQVTGVSSPSQMPAGPSRLLPSTPNPFNPSTTIWFSIDRSQQVSVSIHDVAGRQVAELTSRVFQAGSHRVAWDGRDDSGRAMASGPYLVIMKSEDGNDTQKISLVK